MKTYEVLISESFGVRVEVKANSIEEAETDAFMYGVKEFKDAKEVHRLMIDGSFVVESKEVKEGEVERGYDTDSTEGRGAYRDGEPAYEQTSEVK